MSTPPTVDWLDRGSSLREKVELGLEIVGAYARARWLLWRTDLPTTVAAIRTVDAPRSPMPPESRRTGLRLGRVIDKTLRHLPFDSRCLMRSLVLTSLLARRGIDSTLVIAVAPEPEFHAHAWVESDGAPLLEPAGPTFARMTEI